MENRDIRKMMRNAADYEELQTIIAAANEEIKHRHRKELVKAEYKNAIYNALDAAIDAGFQVIIRDEGGEWICDSMSTIELR